MNPSFYWSVRRELWENRSITIAPLTVAALYLFAFVISTIGMPHRRRAVLLLDPARQRAAIGEPYDVAAIFLIVTAFLVGFFYCLDALYGERRDRSILFWKSMPVSDRTTLLSKAIVPMVILPLFIFAVVVAMQIVMLLWTTMVLAPSGLAATTWTRLPFVQQWLILLYGLVALALWHAPIYGWLLLVSGWARRAAFLWAVLPPLAIAALEKVAFNTTYFGHMLGRRFVGFAHEAFAFAPHGTIDSLAQLTPLQFLASPGLWIGLLFAALFLAAAVRLRRYQGVV